MYKNVGETLFEKYQNKPDEIIFEFLENNVITPLSYKTLYERAITLAHQLCEKAPMGARVIILYPASIDYIVAFFACCFAGMIAVPCYPPSNDQFKKKLIGMIEDCQPELILSTDAIISKLRMGRLYHNFASLFSKFNSHATHEDTPLLTRLRLNMLLVAKNKSSLKFLNKPLAQPELNDVAFLQYTSGTTHNSKGVMVTHANILHNSKLIQHAFHHTEKSRGMIWLPPYHDMGLIGGIIQPVFVGFTGRLMSPAEFLRSPLRWLQQISESRAQTSGGPNFAYQLCLKLNKGLDQLDLSCWENAFCGAEPIRAEVLQKFAEKFQAQGFRRDAFLPCYGLAESTLFISGRRNYDADSALKVDQASLFEEKRAQTTDAAQALHIVSGGVWQPQEQMLRIVDVQTNQPLGDGQVGRIWVHNNSVAKGYWNKPEMTEQVFRNCVPDDERHYLDTGDLGFIHNNELYVTGRIKEILIINGVNYYPQPLEQHIEQLHPAIRQGGVAAIQQQGQDSHAISLVAELKNQSNLDFVQLAETIKDSMLANFSVPIGTVYFVTPKFIPKTTSGKMARHGLQALLRQGNGIVFVSSLQATGQNNPTFNKPQLSVQLTAENIEEVLLETLTTLALSLNVKKLNKNTEIATLFNDSIRQMELLSKLELTLQMDNLPYQLLQDAKTVGELIPSLAQWYRQSLKQGAEVVEPTALAAFPVLPMPYMIMRYFGNLEFNLGFVADIQQTITFEELKKALLQLIDMQPALRTAYPVLKKPGILVDATQVLDLVIGSLQINCNAPAAKQLLEEKIAEFSKQLDIRKAPLFKVLLCNNASLAKQQLIVVFSHNIMDPVSMYLFFQQLELCLIENRRHDKTDNQSIERLQRTLCLEEASLIDLVEATRAHPTPPHAYFANQPHFRLENSKTNTVLNEINLRFVVSDAIYAKIKSAAIANALRLDALLLATTLKAINPLFAVGPLVQFMHNGRTLLPTQHALRQLIGWFTFGWPLKIDIHQHLSLQDAIQQIEQSYQESVPEAWTYNSCMSYGNEAAQQSLIDLRAARVEYSNLSSIPMHTDLLFTRSALFASEYAHGQTFAKDMVRYRDIFIRPLLENNNLVIYIYFEKSKLSQEQLLQKMRLAFEELDGLLTGASDA